MDLDLAYERSYPTPIANSTLLPLLLMSLLQQRYTPSVSDNVKEEYDFIIVGGGAAGSVVASRLSEIPCVTVLLLEAGKIPPVVTEVPAYYSKFWFTDLDWGYQTVPQNNTGRGVVNRRLPVLRGKAIGGSSIYHGMVYTRGNKKDYDGWAAQGAEGWSWKDVLPHFLELEDYRVSKNSENGYHSKGGPVTVETSHFHDEITNPIRETAEILGYKVVDPNAQNQTGYYHLDYTMRNGQRCSAAKSYLVPADERPNLDILSNAFVKKIITEDGQATGVIFDFQGFTYEVRAKREVIISAGVINTPQILMLSGIGPKDHLENLNIPVVADLPVGKNLQNHCGSLTVYSIDVKTPFSEKVKDPRNIHRYINFRTGPLRTTHSIPFEAFLDGVDKDPAVDFPKYQLLFHETSAEAIRKGTKMTNEFYEKMYGPYKNSSLFTCQAVILQPRSRGTITLQSPDPYDPPSIDPNYYSDPKDIDDAVEGMKLCQKIALSRPMKRLNVSSLQTLYPGCEQYSDDQDRYFECQTRSVNTQLNHHVGTAKMGRANDSTTVVDHLLRVKNIEGLRVVDASVMPTIVSGNTYIPTVMIAEKASDIIKRTIKCI